VYWRGPGGGAGDHGAGAHGAGDHGAGDHGAAWSPALDETVARFGEVSAARDALTAASGGPGAVPPGCRVARLA
jgi:hypothetical protein